ncbi:lipid A export permease/ATP-binding protein MsbA [Methylophilaceae bacterium]|jgi:ATP-binding cassette, subfamily B, bacterial MsbA|nr:lipid A export permease/ATP-binding protein MsbA [Methylophilaceae bacterium]
MSKNTAKTNLGSFRKIYLRLLKYTFRYKWVLILSITFLLVLAATNTGFLALIKKITDDGLVQQSAEASVFLPLALIALMTIRALSGYIASYSMRWVSRKIVEDMRYDIFKKLMLLPVKFFDSQAAGNIVSKLTYETEQLSNIVTKVALDAIRDIFTVIAILSYMIYLDWLLTLIFLVMAPIMASYLKIVSPKLRRAGTEVQLSMGDMTRVSQEAVSAQRIVKIFGAGKFELSRFSAINMRNRKMHTKLAKLSGINSFVIEILSALALALVVYYSVGHFSAGEFAAFIGALLMLISPIKKLTAINEQIQIGYAAAISIFSVIDESKEADHGKKILGRVIGKIEFKNVSFNYSQTEKDILKGINLTINPGDKIAFVGMSGGGKSTLINLIPKFYDLKAGKILIDNKNISEIKLSNLREKISLVSQDTILFNDTVYNNIAYGSRSKNKAQIIKAAKAANALEFIEKLPNKFDHIIGDRGVKLSGGQKQRIAIARAILKNAPILLLDEATSALDSESEKYVQNALDLLTKGRTSLVIAHRLSTVLNADRIIVISNGEVVEEGPHNVLIKANKYYTKLYKKGFD